MLSGTNHHMSINWSEHAQSEQGVSASCASIEAKTSIITRLGAQVLSTGAGGWRVRDAVNRVSRALGVTSSVSLGLCDITCSVHDGKNHCTQTVVLPESGVNTNKIIQLGDFLREIDAQAQVRIQEKSEEEAQVQTEARAETQSRTQSQTQSQTQSRTRENVAAQAQTHAEEETQAQVSLAKNEKGQEAFTVSDYHKKMNAIDAKPPLYSASISGLASGFACGAFTFLLGGGLIEMLCAFVGAGLGQMVRRLVLARKINQLLAVGIGVAVSCVAYVAMLFGLAAFVPGAQQHQVGYIGAMLFVIPGFPLITSCLDMFMFDMKSGIERMNYAVVTILIATLIGWLLAVAFQLKPGEFEVLSFSETQLCGLRFLAAFVGVFGFSIMFNSPVRVALVAGVIGGVSDTLNLELVNLVGAPPEIGAFAGALLAGLLAGGVWHITRLSRTAFTVPSVVIMIPGLYLYKAMFYMASFETIDALTWLIRAAMVIVFLPLGLALARAITDVHWRHTS